jgi:hypothetical protein
MDVFGISKTGLFIASMSHERGHDMKRPSTILSESFFGDGPDKMQEEDTKATAQGAAVVTEDPKEGDHVSDGTLNNVIVTPK